MNYIFYIIHYFSFAGFPAFFHLCKVYRPQKNYDQRLKTCASCQKFPQKQEKCRHQSSHSSCHSICINYAYQSHFLSLWHLINRRSFHYPLFILGLHATSTSNHRESHKCECRNYKLKFALNNTYLSKFK